MRGDEHVGRFPVFHPPFERTDLVEHVGSLPAGAVTHAGRQKQTHLVHGLRLAAEILHDAVVVLDRIGRRHLVVAPPVIEKQLSAVREERLHVRVGRVHDDVFRAIAARRVFVEVERLPVPVRVLEDDVAVLVVDVGRRLRPLRLDTPAQLGARHQRREQLRARARVDGRRVNLLRRRDLSAGQARGSVSALAEQHGRIEPARRRVVDEPVLEAIGAVAGGERRLVDHRVLGRRNIARGILQDGMSNPQRNRRPVRGRSGNDAVVVVRKHLGFLEALTSARRAAIPVRALRRHAVERLDQRLGLHGHLVLGAPGEVDELLGMIERERPAPADVSRVG